MNRWSTLTPFLASLVLLAVSLISDNASAAVNFKQIKVETDFKITHPAEIAHFVGSEKNQVALIGEYETGERVLTIYEITDNGIFKQINHAIIPDSFLAYDILQNGVKQKLIFKTKDSLLQFDLEDNLFKPFLKIDSIYLRHKAQFLVRKDFIRDLNNDDLEDIVIPDFRGVHIYLQSKTGDFVHQQLPIEPKVQVNAESVTYNERPLFFADFNLDKRTDIIIVKEKGLLVFPQLESGEFKIDSLAIELPINVSDLNWWEIRESDGQQIDQNKLAHKKVDKIEDINNDGVADLFVRFSKSDGVFDRQNDYEIYLGKKISNKTQYSSTPDSIIRADGTIGELKTIDIDNDKIQELLVSSFDIGVTQIIGALLSGAIDQDIFIFKMKEDGAYPESPNVDKEVEMRFSLSSGKSGNPVVRLADFDGDGRKDLLFSSGEKRLKIYQGTDKSRIFERRSKRFNVTIPKDGTFVDIHDFNKDGKEDVFIRYGRQDDQSLVNQLILFMAI
ncbi:VCBS repeat-containing protein [Aliikangiella sp. G2MR2-5]|uniref:FG-GAP repeat domain-containing protein n=1 Tax=Aliikangiella sp. G2MR2-5 TaxID=2788943 RepID=UPI0018A89008|nr:VCBS repeat-containing protein [Aliikangiella sp. G2MR2-5]